MMHYFVCILPLLILQAHSSPGRRGGHWPNYLQQALFSSVSDSLRQTSSTFLRVIGTAGSHLSEIQNFWSLKRTQSQHNFSCTFLRCPLIPRSMSSPGLYHSHWNNRRLLLSNSVTCRMPHQLAWDLRRRVSHRVNGLSNTASDWLGFHKRNGKKNMLQGGLILRVLQFPWGQPFHFRFCPISTCHLMKY